MIRRFTFEAEIYESLNRLPMAALRKLGAVWIKLHLAQWEQLLVSSKALNSRSVDSLSMSENTPVILETRVGPGTGAAISRRFSQSGYRVAMLACTRDRLDALQREMPNGKDHTCDVTDETQLDSVIDAVRRDLGVTKSAHL